MPYFDPLDDLEMLEHDFYTSHDHNPEENILSYVRDYQGDVKLHVAFNLSFSTIYVWLISGGYCMLDISLEEVLSVEFQSRNGDGMLRVLFVSYKNNSPLEELRIHYWPRPCVVFDAHLS